MPVIILFFISVFIAEIIGTITGFGSSTILIPIALFFFDLKTAIALVAFAHLFGNVIRLIVFKRDINKEMFIYFGIPSIVLTIVGATLLTIISADVLKIILGGVLVLYAAITLKNPIILKQTKKVAVIGGSLSGFFAGLLGVGGAIRSTFLSSFRMSKESYIVTMAAIGMIIDLTRIPIYLSNNFIQYNMYIYIPVLLVLAVVGTIIGKKLVFKMNEGVFRNIILIAISLAGINKICL
ncbi:sulfite exporter TauE/SafE family protein [Candidatus Pacearchaeota archaeon]|nr:sulfite exporter TauE/SafE family protein [Candidatus Pacearchaeota archaeon]